MVFDLDSTPIFQALRWQRIFLFRYASFFKIISFALFLFSFLLFLFFYIRFRELTNPSFSFLGFSIVFLMIYLFFWEIQIFFNLKVKNPEIKFSLSQALLNPEEYNLADFLDFESAKIIWGAVRFCQKRKIPKVNSTALLYSSIKESPDIKFIFLRLGLNPADIQDKAKNYLEKLEKEEKSGEIFSADFRKTIIHAVKFANKRKKQRIGPREVLIGVFRENFLFQDILINSDLKDGDLENVVLWSDFLEQNKQKKKRFWTKENLARHGSLGKDWATGYTVTLDKFSIDWTKRVKKWFFEEIVGHEKEIKKVERALISPKINNVLLVGEPGTGKKSIISALAYRFFLGASFPELNYHRVVELDMISLLSQINDPEEAETILDKIFQEVMTAGNVILVINDFNKYVDLKIQKPGLIDISGILFKYLQSPQFRFIGITDYSGFHEKIEKNPSLLSIFVKVEVYELSEEETIVLLENHSLSLELKYKIFITYPAIREIINLTGRYLPSYFFPEKAINVLEEAVVYVAVDLKEKAVLPSHIEKIITEKTEIPVGEVETKEKKVLLNLERLIHQRIVNQEEAVKEISAAIRRVRSGITSRKRPMGTFLFLGPTGVGKTETSKALAEIYFGGEEKMIRLDMSEFQAIEDIPRLIGTPDQSGLLTTPVRENPFSLLLLDEIEKAHPNILNLFLQVFDEGHITDGQGRKTSFINTIIICTSNAGAPIIFRDVRVDKKLDIIKENLLDYFFKEGIFRPEFINRYDAVIVFKPLTKENLLDIAELILGSLRKNLKEKKIDFLITQSLKEKIVNLSYNPAFGAREMRRVIQDKVENVLAQAILSNKIKKGNKVTIDPVSFKLVINP